jgi:peptidoglycan-N-acetylglucosamine deacetylase
MDLKVADLLASRGLPGTFYVPLTGYRGRPTLGLSGLNSLSSHGFEVGAHGVSHRTLSLLSPNEIEREVRLSKEILEDMLGNSVDMFCYPRGIYNSHVLRTLIEAGYKGARTTRMLSTELTFDPFEMPTSLQVYPHGKWTYVRNSAKARKVSRLFAYLTRFSSAGDWVALGKAFFDRVASQGGIWHLYGHSWEIEERGLWDGLKELLDYVSGRDGVLYASNGAAVNLCRPGSKSV